jgi:flavin-binding protein dodecin
MPDKVYTMVDVVGVSEDSIHQAVRNALSRAGQTLRNID